MVEAQVAGLMKMPVGFVNICKRATFLLNETSRTSARGTVVTELRAVIAKAYARKCK